MEERIEPHKVTKPIQLLAAWLLGLILIDGSFLSAAALLKQPSWAPGFLTVAAVLNVPIFLGSLFLLQTRFRPEMQEDTFYSKYLEVTRATRKPENITADIQTLRSMVTESNSRTIEVVERLQVQVIQLTGQVSRITEETPAVAPSLPAVKAIAQQLTVAQESLEYTKRIVQWQPYDVQVNDLLPSYSEITSKLRAAGIPLGQTFGSTSASARQPSAYVMAFGSGIEVAALQHLLVTLADAGPKYLDYSDDPSDAERFYIGSYGYQGSPVLELEKANLERITSARSMREVLGIIRDSVTRLAE